MTVPANHDYLLSASYRWRFVLVMLLVAVFNFGDRAVFAVLAQAIREDLHLTDFQLGILQGLGFAIFYALLGIPIGRLAERASRTWIVAVATGVWSAMTIASGMAGNFVQLLAARVGVGIGEAGFGPTVNSLVADHFPQERRASAMALILMGTPIGILGGSVIGGFAASHWGWRSALFLLGVPGMMLALLLPFLLREPPRGLVDGLQRAASPPPNFGAFLVALRRKPALCLVLLGGGLAGFGSTAISQFLAVFLARTHHLAIREAAAAYGSISAAFLTIGLLVGSFGTDWLARRGDARWAAWGPAIGLAIAPFVYWAAFRAESFAQASVLLILGGSLLMLFYGPTLGMVANMLEPRMRATGAALFGMLYTIIGSGLGPTFVGFVSDRFATTDFSGGNYRALCFGQHRSAPRAKPLMDMCSDAAAAGVGQALMTTVAVFFVASLCYVLAARTLRRDMFKLDMTNDRERR